MSFLVPEIKKKGMDGLHKATPRQKGGRAVRGDDPNRQDQRQHASRGYGTEAVPKCAGEIARAVSSAQLMYIK